VVECCTIAKGGSLNEEKGEDYAEECIENSANIDSLHIDYKRAAL